MEWKVMLVYFFWHRPAGTSYDAVRAALAGAAWLQRKPGWAPVDVAS